jgi:hypothetical protein
MAMSNQLMGATLLGAAAVFGSIGTAHANLIIPSSPNAIFKTETGQSIPTGVAGFVGGTLANDAGSFHLWPHWSCSRRHGSRRLYFPERVLGRDKRSGCRSCGARFLHASWGCVL